MKEMYDAEETAAEEFSSLPKARQWKLCMEVLERNLNLLELSPHDGQLIFLQMA